MIVDFSSVKVTKAETAELCVRYKKMSGKEVTFKNRTFEVRWIRRGVFDLGWVTRENVPSL